MAQDICVLAQAWSEMHSRSYGSSENHARGRMSKSGKSTRSDLEAQPGNKGKMADDDDGQLSLNDGLERDSLPSLWVE